MWDICSGQLLSTFQSKTECTSLICPMSSHSAIVGTKDGFLLTISLVDIQAIKVVKKLKLFQDFVKILKYMHSFTNTDVSTCLIELIHVVSLLSLVPVKSLPYLFVVPNQIKNYKCWAIQV